MADEISSWWSDKEAKNPDYAVLGSVRGGMIRIPNKLLVAITTPKGRVDATWEAFESYHGNDDAPVLVANAPTLRMNPKVDPKVIEAEYRRGPSMADAEFGAKFRQDLESYVSHEVLKAAVLTGKTVLPRDRKRQYVCFYDAASGSGQDSAALAIAEVETQTLVYLREWKPPFKPKEAVAEAVSAMREYGCAVVTGDNWSKGLLAAEFAAHKGIRYRESK